MSKADPNRVNQKALAADLGLTDRRIRQLTAERIFPDPDDDGRYDLDKCRTRYRLYRDWADEGARSAAWSTFCRNLEEDAVAVERLHAKALRKTSSKKDLRAAGQAVEHAFSDLAFLNAVAGPAHLKEILAAYYDRIRDDMDRALLWRVKEIIAAERGVPVEKMRIEGEPELRVHA